MDINTPVTLREIAAYFDANLSCDVLALDSFSPDPANEIFPIRIEALVIALCATGHAQVNIDLKTYDIQKGTLLVIQPQNFIQRITRDAEFSSQAIMCSPRVVETLLPKLTSMLPIIMQHRMEPAVQLTEDEAAAISSFYTFVKLKLDGPPTLHQRPKVLCMLQAALYEMMDIRMAHCEMQEHRQSRREEIMARFILSICKHFHTERQVSFYAKELCITPKHLSSVVKETSGRTAGEWIDHYVIMEAKMLLASTDMTVQEISSRLNFANQSFFGKYFKHHTGDSPTEFRHKHAATETSPGIDSIGPES